MHTKATLLSALALAETEALLNGVPVRIREVPLSVRLQADERARAGDRFDAAVMWASMVAGGTLDASGNLMFTDEDIPGLAAGRFAQLQQLGEAILALSEARPGDMKSVDRAPDLEQPHPESSAQGDRPENAG